MKNYFCSQSSCNGLLIEAPMKLLMSPPILQYQCLRCGHQYRRTEDKDTFWNNCYQGKDLFEAVEFRKLEWQLRSGNN